MRFHQRWLTLLLLFSLTQPLWAWVSPDLIVQRLQDSLRQHVMLHRDSAKSNAELLKKINKTETYFLTSDSRRNGLTPLQEIASTFALLPNNSTASKDFSDLLEAVMTLLFEQEFDDLEHFVSHGIRHSLNVVAHTRSVYQMHPKFLAKFIKQYQLPEAEARFSLELVALLHDVGYPLIKGLSKVNHSIFGAVQADPLFSKAANLLSFNSAPKLSLWKKDMFKAIYYHSCDSVDAEFPIKLTTNQGAMLTQAKNLPELLRSLFSEQSILKLHTIHSTDTVDNSTLQGILGEYLPNFEHLENPVNFIKAEKPFKGRYADLNHKDDHLFALEFQPINIFKHPLALLRLADNMDMTKSRLSTLQSHPAFRAIYFALGDNSLRGKNTKNLESLSRSLSIADFRLRVESAWKEIGFAPGLDARTQLRRAQNTTQALRVWNLCLVSEILGRKEFVNVPENFRSEMKEVASRLSSYDLRHYGGTEAVESVILKHAENALELEVSVKQQLFEELNTITVKEGRQHVGIGEYQIWRSKKAFESVMMLGQSVQVKTVNEDGARVYGPSELIKKEL